MIPTSAEQPGCGAPGVVLIIHPSFVDPDLQRACYPKLSWDDWIVRRKGYSMRKFCVAVSIAALLLLCGAVSITPPRLGHSIVVSISTSKHQFRVPEKKADPFDDDFFELEVDVIVRNNSPNPVVLCSTDAYCVFPQPYVIRMNQQAARVWSGDVLCAPRFTEANKIRIAPGHEYAGALSWNCFMDNYTEVAGIYTLSVKYSFDPETSHSYGADTNGLSAITSAWSNALTVEIIR